MKRLHIPHPRKRSLTTASTYLAIIMLLSIGFSIIFYRTSMKAFEPANTIPTHQASSPSASSPQLQTTNNGTALTGAPFQQQVATIRSTLFRQLVIFNTGMLVAGAFISYALARRTLRPMEAALETQKRFAADASHELRTPLATMLTEIDVTLRNPHATPARLKAALASSREELINLQTLSEHLLQLAQPTDNTNAAKKTVALDKAVLAAINRFHKVAQAKHIAITDLTPNLTGRIDMIALTQVLAILIDNAIKYSVPRTTITIGGHADGTYVYLWVRDQGIGIRPQDLPHIFDRFYRADISRSHHQANGYGLGLSLAQTIMRQQRGTISVKSEPGSGSTFTLKIHA